jgi:hypothetical protein
MARNSKQVGNQETPFVGISPCCSFLAAGLLREQQTAGKV